MKTSFALDALGIAALASLAGAQQVLGTIAGQSPGERFGTAALMIHDVDNDGVNDLAVGAPGGNFGAGELWVVSGQSLASGTGVTLLWLLVPPASPSAGAFGHSIASVGNLVGDATPDFVVGAPNAATGGTTTGALYLFDGGTMTLASLVTGYSNSRLGSAIAAVGDQNADGVPDLIVTTSPTTNSNLRMAFLPGDKLVLGGSLSVLAPGGLQWGANQAGENLTTGFDHDHDGRLDFAVGAPLNSILHIYRADGSWTFLGLYYSGDDNERACNSVSVGEDYDNDGWLDFLIGAPNWNAGAGTEHGRVIVVSGQSILTPHYPPTVITSLTIPAPGPTPANLHFGTRVLAGPDLNGDGVGEILAGAPDYGTFVPFAPARGTAAIFSGDTLVRIGSVIGANNERIGDTLVGGFHDLNADGFLEFAVAGSVGDTGGTDSGVVKCVSLYPAAPTPYCTGKTNSLGCVPAMSWSGSASASSASPFLVTCSSVINQKAGLLFYSHQPAAAPFQGGLLCVKSPTQRTPQQSSGGSTSGSDCTGAFSFNFNALIQGGADPTLVAGADVFTQYWSRDPAIASTTSLSNGLRFLVNP